MQTADEFCISTNQSADVEPNVAAHTHTMQIISNFELDSI